MNLPGSAKTHLWAGLTVALVGVLVGGYAYTGDRIYRLAFLPVALVGLVLVLGGSALAGYGQANRPRMGGRPSEDDEDEGPTVTERLRASVAGLLPGDDEDDEAADGEPAEAETADADEDEASLLDRASAGATALLAAVRPEADEEDEEEPEPSAEPTVDEGPDPVEADLECPKCRTRFTASGQPPFEAECPDCGHADTVEVEAV